MGETASTGELAMGTGMALTPIGTARAGRGGGGGVGGTVVGSSTVAEFVAGTGGH
jgi:hypothetical protein